MTGNGPENVHLGAAEYSDIQRGGKLDHSMPSQVRLGKEFGNSEKSGVLELEAGRALLTINPEAAGVRGKFMVEHQTIESRKALGKKEPPRRDISYMAGRVVG